MRKQQDDLFQLFLIIFCAIVSALFAYNFANGFLYELLRGY